MPLCCDGSRRRTVRTGLMPIRKRQISPERPVTTLDVRRHPTDKKHKDFVPDQYPSLEISNKDTQPVNEYPVV